MAMWYVDRDRRIYHKDVYCPGFQNLTRRSGLPFEPLGYEQCPCVKGERSPSAILAFYRKKYGITSWSNL